MEKLVLLMLIVLAALLVLFVVAMFPARCDTIYQNAVVLDRRYSAGSSSSGSGVVIDSKGNPGVVMINSSKPSSWEIVFRLSSGKVVSDDISEQIFYDTLDKPEIQVAPCYSILGNQNDWNIKN